MFWGFGVFFGGWGGPILFKISDPKQNDISKQYTKSQKCSSKITKVIPSQSFHKCGTNIDNDINDTNPARIIVSSKWNFVETKNGNKDRFFQVHCEEKIIGRWLRYAQQLPFCCVGAARASTAIATVLPYGIIPSPQISKALLITWTEWVESDKMRSKVFVAIERRYTPKHKPEKNPESSIFEEGWARNRRYSSVVTPPSAMRCRSCSSSSCEILARSTAVKNDPTEVSESFGTDSGKLGQRDQADRGKETYVSPARRPNSPRYVLNHPHRRLFISLLVSKTTCPGVELTLEQGVKTMLRAQRAFLTLVKYKLHLSLISRQWSGAGFSNYYPYRRFISHFIFAFTRSTYLWNIWKKIHYFSNSTTYFNIISESKFFS